MDQSNLLAQLKPRPYLRLGVILFLILFAGKFVVFYNAPQKLDR